jgi:hypothetical protein
MDVRQDATKKLTATINRREIGCRDEALYVRRFGIGRCQERGECYTTLRQAIGLG